MIKPMALTRGSLRHPVDKEVVLVQARVSREAKQRIKEMADACGMAQGLFLERLVEGLPLDSHGRPLCIELPQPTNQEDLFTKAS